MVDCANPTLCDSDPEDTNEPVSTDDTTDSDQTSDTGTGTNDTDSNTTNSATPQDQTVGITSVSLASEAEQSADDAIESLATRLATAGDPVEVDAFGLESPMNALAAAIVGIGMAIALIGVGIRNWKRAWVIPSRWTRFALISLFGVAVSLALWEITLALSGDLAVIPEDINLAGDIWSNPFATLTIPSIEVLLDSQPWIVGILIVSLPLAAAISMFGPYDRLIWVVIALVVANMIWLPFVIVLSSRLLLSTDAAHAGWWSLAACSSALATNSLAIAVATRTPQIRQ